MLQLPIGLQLGPMKAEDIAAVGIWATLVVYLIIAVVAFWQLRESRNARLQQTRPFVIVDVHFRTFLVELEIKNTGSTAARNVQVRLDSRLDSSYGADHVAWQDTALFNGEMSMMAPGRIIRFLIDGVLERSNSGLPMQISGTVTYECDQLGELNEPFILDLSDYLESQTPKSDHPEILKEVERLRKSHEKIERSLRDISRASQTAVSDTSTSPDSGQRGREDRGESAGWIEATLTRIADYFRNR